MAGMAHVLFRCNLEIPSVTVENWMGLGLLFDRCQNISSSIKCIHEGKKLNTLRDEKKLSSLTVYSNGVNRTENRHLQI